MRSTTSDFIRQADDDMLKRARERDQRKPDKMPAPRAVRDLVVH